MPDYSIIVPVFNSCQSLDELFSQLDNAMKGLRKSYRVIFVDDGSSDASWEKLSLLQQKVPDKITAIRLARNFGQHNATLCGIAHADGEYIVTIDDDLQNPPSEIARLITTMQETDADLVYGIPADKKHSAARNAGSKVLKKGSKRLFSTKGEGSSFRLMKSALAKNLLNHQINFVYIDEIFNWYTNHIAFVNVDHRPRPYQQSNYTPRSLFSLLTNLVIYYTAIPLRLMVYGGFFSALLSFIFGVFFIYRKLVMDVPLGFTAIIVAILFSTSVILLSLGVIGEYLSRIYMVQNRKPPFAIKEMLK